MIMQSIQLSLFDDYQQVSYSPTLYLARAWWDNVVHMILKCCCFLVTTGAIIIATATGTADCKTRTQIESVLKRRRREAEESGDCLYLVGIKIVDGQPFTAVDTIKENCPCQR
jgi:hypothetical protein